jgi:hypothetical protein
MKFGRLKSSLPIYNQSPQFLQSDDSEKPQGTFVISSMWFCLIGYAMFLLCECRAELFNLTSWQFWVMKASAPPLEPMLSLYTELRALNWSFAFITGRSENERDLTEQNLLAAGYEGWAALILRSVASCELLLSIVVFTLVTQMQILLLASTSVSVSSHTPESSVAVLLK